MLAIVIVLYIHCYKVKSIQSLNTCLWEVDFLDCCKVHYEIRCEAVVDLVWGLASCGQ